MSDKNEKKEEQPVKKVVRGSIAPIRLEKIRLGALHDDDQGKS